MDSKPPSINSQDNSNIVLHTLIEYADIFAGLLFAILAFYFHLNGHQYLSVLVSAVAIGAFSITVAEIAEILADRLEEPYASFVLTFSAVAVEIILLFMIVREAVHSP